MQLTRNLFALIFCLTLFSSCTVDEIEDDTQLNKIEDVQATDDDGTPPDTGNGGS
ncbi:hypothetical protein [Pontimicrobium aquaticum]|uniref:hypothetical protein n=1 Tax=Pontimicrobium aquaticum TaxID=2565367 RepID=UPI00145E5EA7|nr:hypothetical protein [Pontimicrobium aquaticum]